MKIVLLLVMVLFSAWGEDVTPSSKASLLSEYQIQTMKTDSIIYIATSRGFFEKIVITKDIFKLTNDRTEKEYTEQTLKQEGWNGLIDQLAKVPLENIENFQPTTNYRATDGAAFAHIEIYCNGDVFQSPDFDHGRPPKEISALVKQLQSLRDKLFED